MIPSTVQFITGMKLRELQRQREQFRNSYRRLRQEKRQARMLLQIHDELVFEVPPDELNAVAGLVREEMTQALAPQLQVPLKVDLAVGPNWLDLKGI